MTKRFSSPFNAVLERQAGATAGKWHTVAQGAAVDGKLRELLCWGMAPPGGKGALSKKESYLVVALLGRQGEVQQILESSLEGDQDDTGKVSITEGVGALGSDPRVTDIVERLSERIDEVFTPTGKLKADGRFARGQAASEGASRRGCTRCTARRTKRRARRSRRPWSLPTMSGCGSLREHREAEAALKAAQLRHEQNKVRRQLQGEIDECRATLDQAAQLRVRLAGLRAGLDAAVEAERAERATLAAAVVAVDGLSLQVQEASEDVVRAQAALARTGLEDEASRQQRRIVLTGQKAAVQDRLRQVEAAEAITTRLAQLESEFAAGTQRLLRQGRQIRNARSQRSTTRVGRLSCRPF